MNSSVRIAELVRKLDQMEIERDQAREYAERYRDGTPCLRKFRDTFPWDDAKSSGEEEPKS